MEHLRAGLGVEAGNVGVEIRPLVRLSDVEPGFDLHGEHHSVQHHPSARISVSDALKAPMTVSISFGVCAVEMKATCESGM